MSNDTETTSLSEFLLARIEEDEQDAGAYSDDDSPGTWRNWGEAVCKAHRAIVKLHDQRGERWTGFPRADRQEDYCLHDQQSSPCPTIRALASIWADHEEYRSEWRDDTTGQLGRTVIATDTLHVHTFTWPQGETCLAGEHEHWVSSDGTMRCGEAEGADDGVRNDPDPRWAL